MVTLGTIGHRLQQVLPSPPVDITDDNAFEVLQEVLAGGLQVVTLVVRPCRASPLC